MACGVAFAATRPRPSTILFIGGGEIPISAFPFACLAMHGYTDVPVGERGMGAIEEIIGGKMNLLDAREINHVKVET
jgi:hypothetical protein